MELYTQTMRENAQALEETVDRITLEPIDFDSTTRHATIALEAEGRIQYWDTEALYNWITTNNKHPLLNYTLSYHELNYINHYHSCLTLEKDHPLNEKTILDKFILSDGYIDEPERLKARAALSPRNFADHFKDFLPLENDIVYERTQAEKLLSQSTYENWLIRHSSLNRPSNPNHQQLIDRLGLQYYVISFNCTEQGQKRIIHILILHRPGWGWARIRGITYTKHTVIPSFSGLEQYDVCFTDILLRIIRSENLRLSDQLSGYARIPVR